MNPNRRVFLTSAACSGACLLASTLASSDENLPASALPDFDALAYCATDCRPEICPLRRATLENDLEFKKKVAARWKEKRGLDVAPGDVFCFGCKVPPEKQSQAVSTCTVRACVVARRLVSCAHCPDLASCAKELWTNYPKFRERVLEIQKRLKA